MQIKKTIGNFDTGGSVQDKGSDVNIVAAFKSHIIRTKYKYLLMKICIRVRQEIKPVEDI